MVDVGLTFTPIENGGLDQIHVGTERLCVIVSQDSALIGKPAVTLADIKSCPLIVACLNAHIPSCMHDLECRAGFRPTIAEEVTRKKPSTSSSRRSAAILPYGVCEEAPPSIRYFPISGAEPLELVFLRRHDHGLAAEILEELAGALDDKNVEYAS